jgi:hypothetical protein
VTPSNIGVNLNFNVADYVWVDVRNLFSTWGPLGNPGGSPRTIPVNADNYPLAPASAVAGLNYYPDGNYALSYQGTATVSFSGAGYLAGPIVTNSSGVHTGTVVVNHAAGLGGLTLNVTGVSTTATMSNFHLYSPGYGTNPTQMFTNAFLNQLKPFSTIRFENWNNVINSTASTWQTRVLPASFVVTGTTGAPGVPYEDMIELANEAQKDMWINIPALANANYVQNLAQLIYNNLDPNLNVYVEYSDETWDAIWLEYSQVLKAAQSNPLITASGPSQKIEQQSAYELVSIAQTFNQVFGASKSRVRPIIAGFSDIPSLGQTQLQFIQTHYGTPNQYVWGLAIAPYLSLPNGDDVAGLSLDQLFADLNQYLNTTYVSDLQTNEALAKSYNLPLVSYEGGTSLSAVNGKNTVVKKEAQVDPRMYQIYVNMINDWNQYVGSGSLFMAFLLDSSYTDNRFFGLFQTVANPGGQKFNALLSEIEPAGDANLDGLVDEADIQILEANYGLSNTWWEQGDFNDDGIVNWSDLNLLRTNLDPAALTLSQFAQLALFGQPSVLPAGQAPEYDGYGMTYVSDMPWSSSSNGAGSIAVDKNVAGQPLQLNGSVYTHGLEVSASSSVNVNLAGKYATFRSQIGVPSSSPASSVIFQVYGDGKLLYQSPVTSASSGSIPVSVNVAGVQQLTLDVIAAKPNTIGNFAIWADPRLTSTANFATYHVVPYTMSWQVSENGQVLSAQTTDSFLFFYTQPGVYTISLTVTDVNGVHTSASTTVTINPLAASATPLNRNTTTQGSWVGTYGSQAREVIGGATLLPSYAAVAAVGESTITWAASTTDPRGLVGLSGTGRVAAAWSSTTSFTVNVNLADGAAHDLALYVVDWDNHGRSEGIQITNAASGAVLDTETVSSFAGGVYLNWRVSGNVVITVTRQAGPTAVLSGIFLDAPPTTITPVRQDTTTKGSWIGSYGSQGYDVIGLPSSLPSYATVTASPFVAAGGIWDESATNPLALQVPGQTNGYAGYWSTTTSMVVNVNLNDGRPHDLAIYVVDWANQGRRELIQLASAATGKVLSADTLTTFAGGEYLQWMVTGSVVITITNLGGPAAVLSGLFFDPPSSPQVSSQAATAKLVKRDASTEGNWIGAYGTQGYNIVGNATHYPAYAKISPYGQSTGIWTTSTTAARALRTASGTGRIAAEWFSATSFVLNVDMVDGQAHNFALYGLDWNNQGRVELIQVADATTGVVLDSETISNFAGGVYLQWVVSGNVMISVTTIAGANAEVSGLFFDPPSTVGATAADVLRVVPPPTAAIAGTAQNWTVTAVNPSGAVDTHYAGTIQFSSSDPKAALPAKYTFTSTEAGTHTFSVTLNTVGTQAITATDSTTPTIKGSASVTVNSPASAVLVKRDTATKGNWVGTYGSQGYNIIGSSASYPSYATVKTVGASTGTFDATTTDPRALQNASGTGRTAACWFGSTYSVGVNLTDGQAHDLTLYAIDWSNIGRTEQIQITSAATGAVLDTETLSNFYGGVYLQWKLSGSVVITLKTLAGANSVVSGIFFDPPSAQAAAQSELSNVAGPLAGEITGIANNVTNTTDAQPGNFTSQSTATVRSASTDRRGLSSGTTALIDEALASMSPDVNQKKGTT